MALSDAYLSHVKNLKQILQAIRQAQPPERFTHKFLEGLDFKSTNDRGIIGVLKALGFIDESGTPKQPYYDYMDDERHRTVLAEGLRRAYADLFKLNKEANEKEAAWVKNKLKILTQGAKSDVVIAKMATTFIALCKEADFSTPVIAPREAKLETPVEPPTSEVSIQEQPQAHAFTDRFTIAEIALPHTRQPGENPRHSFLVIQIVQPLPKRHSSILRAERNDFFWCGEHRHTVAFKLQYRQVRVRKCKHRRRLWPRSGVHAGIPMNRDNRETFRGWGGLADDDPGKSLC